jgi:drug/metabolite transporter (DMT)-like permease
LPTSKKISAAGFVIAFAGAVLFSTKAIMVKLAFTGTGVDALSLLMLRMLCALPFYIAVVWYSNTRQQKIPLTAKQWWQLLWLGLFGYYLSSLLDFEGLQYVSAGLERLLWCSLIFSFSGKKYRVYKSWRYCSPTRA